MSNKRSALHDGLSGVTKSLLAQAGQTPKGERKARNITQLADVLEQERPNVSAKLNGSRVWSLDDFLAIAQHYEVPLDTMLKMMDDELEHRAQVKNRLSKIK